MKGVKILLVLVSYFFLAGYAHNAGAQNFPTKHIRVIVPFAAGGSNDLFARALQKSLGKELNGTIVGGNRDVGSNATFG